jgi:hypothetical protein
LAITRCILLVCKGIARLLGVGLNSLASHIGHHSPKFAIPCTITAAAQIAPTGTDQDCVPGTRHYGNEGRDSLRGPSFKEFNFAVFENTAITERVNMQFRADFFNLPNHPNFANPFLPAFVADAGFAGYAVNGAGREVGGGPRGIQFAVKFSF